MRSRFMITTLAILFLTNFSFGQMNYEPLELAKKIFAKEKFKEIKKYITGEYKGRPNGRDLGKGSITKFTLLGQTEKSAVVNMTIIETSGKGLDSYLHFEKDKIWKVNAFRTLAITGIIEQIKIELESMTPQQVDTAFSSKEDYNFQLGNSKLILELDDNIIKHFLTNQKEFERIKVLALKQLENETVDEERSLKLIENLKQDYQSIFIRSVSIGGYELGPAINFLIGGMVDNSVGYIYLSDKKDLPKMNPNRVIMLREIGNGWYLYKTT